MSLPEGEQQVLDGIAETLRASEPRLASMFAIFGRLFRNDGPPLRERLPAARPFAPLAAMWHRLRHRRGSSVPGAGSRDTGSWTSRRSRRRRWQLVFVIANVVAAVAILAVLFALNAHSARDCTRRPSPTAPVFVFRGGDCPAQAGSGASAPPR
jgi:Protein of unknown function (DUF3040)